MPNESVNLYLSIQSGNSENTLVSLTDKIRALDKETQLLQQATEALTKANKPLIEEQTKLQAQMKLSQKAVNDLQRSYDEYGDEMMKLDLDQAIENHARLKEELSEVNAQIGANQKTYKEYLETVRKGSLSENQSLGSGQSSLLSGTSDFTKSHLYSELVKPLASAGGALGELFLTSMIGTPSASLVSDTLSNAISGAVAGSILGPGGAVAGAVLGGITGLVTGGTKIFEAKDDAFKEYYGGLYSDVSGRSGEMVESGSALASGRQTDRISFKTLFGSEQIANDYLDNLVEMANYTPFLYDDLTAMSKTLATYGYDADNILPLLQTIGDTGAALGMSTSDMTTVAQALGRMKSSDKTTLEYLNILNDRGIGAVGYLADAYGVSQGDMYSMISKGDISGTDAVRIITEALQNAYEGAMLEQSQTFAGITSTLEGLEQELENAGGDAYNTLRQSGKSAMVEAYGGELGDAIKEINAVMGENQARRENLQDQYMREVLDAVLNGKQGSLWSAFDEDQQNTLTEMSQRFAEWSEIYEASGRTDEEAGAQMEALYEEAQTLGQAYYDNSDFVKMLNDTEIDEIEAIQQATVGLENAYTALYNLDQTLSRGLAVRWVGDYGYTTRTAPDSTALAAAEDVLSPMSLASGAHTAEELNAAAIVHADAMAAARRNAFGLDRVPYDDYPALLHEGERVLTASEARAQDAGAGAPLSLTITGNSFMGTSEEMADQMWEIIVRKLEQAAVASAPK